MRRVIPAAGVLLVLFAAVTFAHAGDVAQKGKISTQKGYHHTQKRSTQKGATQKDSSKKDSTQKDATQKGKGKSDTCERCHSHHWFFHCKNNAPRAPILGSAPAMMAPVILVQNQQQRAPQSQRNDRADELEELKSLLKALDDLVPERRAAPRAPAANNPNNSSTNEVLDKLVGQLAEQQRQLNAQQQFQARFMDKQAEISASMIALGKIVSSLEKRLDEKKPNDGGGQQ